MGKEGINAGAYGSHLYILSFEEIMKLVSIGSIAGVSVSLESWSCSFTTYFISSLQKSTVLLVEEYRGGVALIVGRGEYNVGIVDGFRSGE